MTAATLALSQKILTSIAAADLSEISRKQYVRKLEILSEGHPDIWSAISKHKATIATLLEKYGDKPASLQVFSGAVLSSFKHVPELKVKAPEALLAWKSLSEEAQKPMQARVLAAQPTARQAEGWVPCAEVVRKRDALPSGSDARLLLSMYSILSARRNDFASMIIYPSQPPEGTGGNYMVIPTKGRAFMMLNEYKTSKTYKGVSEDLPEALIAEVRANLARRKPESRGYLFVAPRSGQPHKNESAFSKWANALLHKTFRKKVTLTILRHAAVTALDFNNMTPGERAEVARLMGHSVLMQMNYRFLFKEPGGVVAAT